MLVKFRDILSVSNPCRAYSSHRVSTSIPAYNPTTPPRPRRWPADSERSGGRRPSELSRISRELAYLLRHGAQKEGLPIRNDGYVSVDALLRHHTLQGVDFPLLEKVVQSDKKKRYHLCYAPDLALAPAGGEGSVDWWWIRAEQGHSMENIELDLNRIFSAEEIPMAVHGTTMRAWESIATQGLSRMSRNHIHLAQGAAGDVISGMRTTSEVLIFIDVARALQADIKFYVSRNGVVLTPGNEEGILERRFFEKVERVRVSVGALSGWEGEGRGDVGDVESGGGKGGVGAGAVKKERRTKSSDDAEREREKMEEREKRKKAREREKRNMRYEESIRKLYTPEELELV